MSLLGIIGSYLVGVVIEQLQANEAVVAPAVEGLAISGAQDLVAAIEKADAHLPLFAKLEINAILNEYEPQLAPFLQNLTQTGFPAVIAALEAFKAHLASL